MATAMALSTSMNHTRKSGCAGVSALLVVLFAACSGTAEAQGYSKERMQATVDRITEPAKKAQAACRAAKATAQEAAKYIVDETNLPPERRHEQTPEARQQIVDRMMQTGRDAQSACAYAQQQIEESSRRVDAYFADLNRGLDAMERDMPRTTNCIPTGGGGFNCQTY